jgi:hypothetical protein
MMPIAVSISEIHLQPEHVSSHEAGCLFMSYALLVWRSQYLRISSLILRCPIN